MKDATQTRPVHPAREIVERAARHLATSARGRQALRALEGWLADGGVGLDAINQSAVITLLEAAWGPFAGSTQDIISAVLDDQSPVTNDQ